MGANESRSDPHLPVNDPGEEAETLEGRLHLSRYTLAGIVSDGTIGELRAYRHLRSNIVVYAKVYRSDLVAGGWLAMKQYVLGGQHRRNMYTTVDAVVTRIGDEEGSLEEKGSGVEQIMVFVRDLERDLQSEIEFRRPISAEQAPEHFPEAEIWYMLECIIEMENQMAVHSRVHGDLRPKTVFISEDGFVRFFDSNIVEANMNSFWKTVNNVQRCPLPPENLLLLKTRSYKLTDMSKTDTCAEVWSIGIVLVCMADLRSADHYYDWNSYRVRASKLDESMLHVKQRYSPLLFTTIQTSLEDNPKTRCSLDSLRKALALRKSQSTTMGGDTRSHNISFTSSKVQTSFSRLN